MSDQGSITQFPNFSIWSDTPSTLPDSHGTVKIERVLLQEASLVRCWAKVLRSYTGNECVSFYVNDDIVTINTSTFKLSKCPVHSNNRVPLNDASTAVVVSSASKDHDQQSALGAVPYSPLARLHLSLCLEYRSHESCILLHAAGTALPTLLPLVKQRLSNVIHDELAGVDQQQGSASPAEESLSISNPFPRRLCGPVLLHQLAFSKGQLSSPAVDFVDGKGKTFTLSYEELDDLSDSLSLRLSHALRDQNVSRDSHAVVPLLFQQSFDLYVAILATLKAGVGFCPLTVDVPRKRLQFIISDLCAKVILTTPDHKPTVFDSLAILVLTTSPSSVPTCQVFRDACPQDVAYVMYSKLLKT